MSLTVDYKVLEFFIKQHQKETKQAKAEWRTPPKFNDLVKGLREQAEVGLANSVT